MKIYTKTGDAGQTGLFGGPRVTKDHARIEAFGTVDELNSHLGMARSQPKADLFDELLRIIQCDLFELGAELATPGDHDERIKVRQVQALENAIEYLNRLGDLLFVLARTVNKQAHVKDDPWHPS